MPSFKTGFPILAGLTLVMLWVSIYMAFQYAPVEAEMGMLQKIFYFHVPSAMAAYLGFFMAFIFSIVYLLQAHLLKFVARRGPQVFLHQEIDELLVHLEAHQAGHLQGDASPLQCES